MRGLHKSIELSFLLVGHTKFSPDGCFGLFKKLFRVTKVDSLDDIAGVVVSSAQVNEVQLVGTQSGEIIVQTYDWTGFFGSQMKKIPLITKYHHFQFYSSNPGTVTVREYSDSLENVYVLTHSTLNGLPETVHPRGLSLERQWYLHDKIREFCAPETRDLVCPKPQTPKPRSSSAPPSPPSPQPSLHQNEENDPSQPSKKRRVCGSCGQLGHNKRTCMK